MRENNTRVTEEVRIHLSEQGISTKKMAEDIHVLPQSIEAVLTDADFFPPRMAHNLASTYGFDEEYLLSGIGALYAGRTETTDEHSEHLPHEGLSEEARRERLKMIRQYLNCKACSDMGAKLGVPNTRVHSWFKRGTYDAELIITKYPEFSGDWLLIGRGPMIRRR